MAILVLAKCHCGINSLNHYCADAYQEITFVQTYGPAVKGEAKMLKAKYSPTSPLL
jgi:hypothetical protein